MTARTFLCALFLVPLLSASAAMAAEGREAARWTARYPASLANLKSHERARLRGAVRAAQRMARRDEAGLELGFYLGAVHGIAGETAHEGIRRWQDLHAELADLERNEASASKLAAQTRYMSSADLRNPYRVKQALDRLAERAGTTPDGAAIRLLKDPREMHAFIQLYVTEHQAAGGARADAFADLRIMNAKLHDSPIWYAAIAAAE